MQVDFPIQCACGLENVIHEDMPRQRIIVECECGTKLTISVEEWYRMTQAQIAREIKQCCCDWNGREP